MTVQSSPTDEQVREFVIAGHGNFNRVKQMLLQNPSLLNAGYKWKETDIETAIQAAAQVGNKSIAEYLLQHGSPLHICTAAMLGRRDQVRSWLDSDPRQAKALGAHGIPLLPHAVFSDDIDLVRLVYERGATDGVNLALHNAVLNGNPSIVQWLLEHTNPDINTKNYEGKTPLRVASERNQERIVGILATHGAHE
jgi:ankyrin repeat protein